MPTSRSLAKQKLPRKKQGRNQRADWRENPLNGVPWANRYDFLTAADPTITSLVPNTIAASAPATLITVNGTLFGPGSAVEVNGVEQTTTYVSTTVLRITQWDPTVAGTVQFTVRNTTGKESNNSPFTVTAAAAADPTSSWTKAEIIAWLVDRGVVVDGSAAEHFTKDELLAIVAAYLNDDPELDSLLEG